MDVGFDLAAAPLCGDGCVSVAVADEFSEVSLKFDVDPSSNVCTLVLDSCKQSPSAPAAPTTAETTTAGAGAAAPRSFQKPDIDVPECDRECSSP